LIHRVTVAAMSIDERQISTSNLAHAGSSLVTNKYAAVWTVR
jgi:hypothetical protein